MLHQRQSWGYLQYDVTMERFTRIYMGFSQKLQYLSTVLSFFQLQKTSYCQVKKKNWNKL